MFGKPLTLFQLFGFKIKIDLSWAFLALLIAWSLATGFFPVVYAGLPAHIYWWMGIAGVIGLFFSIVFHELAHSLVARRYGLPIRGITLFLFGGIAEMEEEPVSPKAEFWMAIAGPIASLILAGLFFVLAAAFEAANMARPAVAVASYLSFLNGVLAVFNLLPAFPLDGGRMLRAFLWARSGNLMRATTIAGRIGGGFAYLLMGLGLLSVISGNFVGGLWWVLIGLFLRSIAAGSTYQVLARQTLEGKPIRRFMTQNPMSVNAGISVQDLVENYVYRYYFDLFPVVAEDRLIGCVGTREVRQVPREEWEKTKIADIAVPCSEDNSIGPDEEAIHGLAKMQRTGNSRLIVRQGAHLLGLVALKDMLNLLTLKMDLEGRDT